jgi:hypothetical protein
MTNIFGDSKGIDEAFLRDVLREVNKSAARRYHFSPFNYATGRHPIIPLSLGIDINECIMVNNCRGHHLLKAWFNEDFLWALSHTLAHHWQVNSEPPLLKIIHSLNRCFTRRK